MYCPKCSVKMEEMNYKNILYRCHGCNVNIYSTGQSDLFMLDGVTKND